MSEPSAGAVSRPDSLALLSRARVCGVICAVLFGLAALSILDGLQTLMRHDFNRLDLIPGETSAISGSMPQGAATHTDLAFTLEGASGLRFTPLESFKGFWFGGLMWRGEIAVAPEATPGEAVLTVIDRVSAKKVEPEAGSAGAPDAAPTEPTTVQNPMLVHRIHIYPDAAARRADEHSVLLRLAGIPPFASAAFFAVCAFAAGAVHWVLFGRAERALAAQGMFFVHGIKPDAGGTLAVFAHLGSEGVVPGAGVRLLEPGGQAAGRGKITEVNRHKGFALFPPTGRPPRYGRLVALDSDPR